jgi:hypothetical protein
MRTALATTALAVALTLAVVPPATAKPPTQRQIAQAVTAAEKSSSLWATINICNSRRHPDEIGVRGQMPSLGFAASMAMTVRLDSWSASTKSFVPIDSPNAADTVALGTHSRGLEQGGTIFPFQKGQTGLWNATIVFIWKRNGKIVGQTQRRTTAGHRTADFGSPPHYSVAHCQIL